MSSLIGCFEEMVTILLHTFEIEIVDIDLVPKQNKLVCIVSLKERIQATIRKVDEFEAAYIADINRHHDQAFSLLNNYSKFSADLHSSSMEQNHLVNLRKWDEAGKMITAGYISELLVEVRVKKWRADLEVQLKRVNSQIENL